MPLVFQTELPVEPPAPNRMDVACFVGFVRPRGGGPAGAVTSPAIQDWLRTQGWLQDPFGLKMPYARGTAATYLDVPIPIASWTVFDRLFAWDARAMEGSDALATTYLGAAVRSFFAEGGQRCYVVRAGDDWPVPAGITVESAATIDATRAARLEALVPGYPGSLTASPADRTSWHGVGHVFGLPDVSFVCCPDLADILRAPATPPVLRVTLPSAPEQFLACSDADLVKDDDPAVRYEAPRAGESEFAAWHRVLEIVRNALVATRTQTQFVATVPMPVTGSSNERTLRDVLQDFLPERNLTGTYGPRVSSFVQFAFPWAVTRGSRGLPEGLEPAEGAFTGVLARNALVRGTFRSAAGLTFTSVEDAQPALSPNEVGDRVSLFGLTPRGMQVLTDVTASGADQFQPAGLHRLVSSIVRAARRIGEDAVFDASGEQLWAGIRTRIEAVLLALWRDGALRGATPADAFDVRCDRSTMTQLDLDAGRAVAVVRFDPAAPIDSITVVLALDAAGSASLATTEAA